MNNKNNENLYTISAFLLGFILSQEVDSTMQSVIGNWFMLVGQTLCTSSAYKFNKDWNNHFNNVDDINNMINVIKNSMDKINKFMK